MKTELKILKLIVSAFAVLSILSLLNCNDKYDCPGYPPDGNLIYEFHKEDSLKIPYTGTDTLIFLRTKDSTIKDTVVFIGQGKKYSLEYLRQEKEMTPCEYQVLAQRYEIEYVAKNISGLKFRFIHQAQSTPGGEIDILFNNSELYFSLWNWDWGNGYYDYIEFNSFIFRHVRQCCNYSDDCAFYNFEFGIIRFEFDNLTYNLINK